MATRMRDTLNALREELRYEPVSQRIRILHGDDLLAETTEALVVWEPRCVVPAYAVPEAAIRVPLRLTPYEPVDPETLPPVITPEFRGVVHLLPGRTVSLTVGETELEHIGYQFDDPDLAGYVLLRWDPLTWQEETVTMTGHTQDPFSRIRILPSDRHVVVSHRGTELASSRGAVLLLETGLPPRWYLPREDLTTGIFEDSELHTVCAYKGLASYLSSSADPSGRDLGWYYPEPLHDAAPVRDLVCFWSERTDLVIDGVVVPRPDSPFTPRGTGA